MKYPPGFFEMLLKVIPRELREEWENLEREYMEALGEGDEEKLREVGLKMIEWDDKVRKYFPYR